VSPLCFRPRSPAYAFGSGSYVTEDTLREGTGYWLLFGQPDTIVYTGALRGLDSLDLPAGWNLVGMISDSVPTAAVQTVPAGTRCSPFFAFTGEDYVAADLLIPGNGYWVKMSTPGTLIFPAPAPMRWPSSRRHHRER
jgi:hypothetical protein